MSVEAKLSRLSLELKTAQSPRTSGSLVTNTQTPDSWEDDADDDTPVEAPGPTLKSITSRDDTPNPPPPTPISPTTNTYSTKEWASSSDIAGARPTSRGSAPLRGTNDKRPEKTTATANRMIAGALGIKAPKKTEEQKQYDKAVKEAEIKRKNKEKQEREAARLEDEKAKDAVWDG